MKGPRPATGSRDDGGFQPRGSPDTRREGDGPAAGVEFRRSGCAGGHRSGEAVTPAGDSFDDGVFGALDLEGFTEERDVTDEADFLDDGVGPDELHEIGFVDDLAVALNEDVEGFSDLGEEGDAIGAAEEQPLIRVVANGPK